MLLSQGLEQGSGNFHRQPMRVLLVECRVAGLLLQAVPHHAKRVGLCTWYEPQGSWQLGPEGIHSAVLDYSLQASPWLQKI